MSPNLQFVFANPPVCLPVEAGKDVTDFAAALTEAVVTHNTLELADGTFFLGEARLGSKLFIRPCYKELSELVLDGATTGTFKDIVVTGTPGIGKSVFGLYLLYLLRCQGKTVVFEMKVEWYRFSNAGVEKGGLREFIAAGYLRDDSNDWYLSDPQDRPFERFSGTTVVLVSPKRRRTHEFLKNGGTQCFMPVWGEDELLECRLALFPLIPSAVVKEVFLVVGGVARAVFGGKEMELRHKREMKSAANEIDLGMLRRVFTDESSSISTDAVGDLLFHVVPSAGTGFKIFTVDFASDYARNLMATALPKQEERALASFVAAAFSNEELGRKIGGIVKGTGFERVAHNTIRGARANKVKFDIEILRESVEGPLNKRWLSFDFSEETGIFKGNAFPDTVVSGKYYVPESQTFPAIDSFGVNQAGDTLYFFQMKSAGVKRDTNGTTVEEHWKTVQRSEDVSIKRCVFVYVVPPGFARKKTPKLVNRRCWKKDTNDFACDVCVMEMPLPGYGRF